MNEKSVGDFIILLMCTKNRNHIRYGSWYREWDRQNFLSFRAIFCPFTLDNPENHNFEKLKKASGDVIILHMYTKNHNHNYDVCCLRYGVWQIICHFGPFFTLLSPYWPKKIKCTKTLDIILIQMCTINKNHMIYGSWDISNNEQSFCHSGPFFAFWPSS